MMEFIPNYQNLVDAAMNKRPKRLPLYEHVVDSEIVAAVLNEEIVDIKDNSKEQVEKYVDQLCRFYKHLTYDTVSFERGVGLILPGHGAIYGGKLGPIQNREDFEKFPWEKLHGWYWDRFTIHFDALRKYMPEGMKAVGGLGMGVFEISEDLVGYEPLCMLQYDDPQLFGEIYQRIGDLMVSLWKTLLDNYGDVCCVCRMGDDLGFKSSTLLAPDVIREHVVPQYIRIVDQIHSYNKPFLFHSCGNIFPVMDDIISRAKINAKHSNEDQIAPYEEWISKYSDRIGLFGGIDVNDLCLKTPDEIYSLVIEKGTKFRISANGYALGSGNSIPKYVPLDGYKAMIKAVQEIRVREDG
ncbi:MAG: hypothetical protein JNL74_17995 [Fibrobacteres bacterium]|nr:hypothetical protein [Fibrobacterota bacterium]